MKILSETRKKLTSFYNKVVCKLEKTPQKDLLKGNKPLSWWRKIKNMNILRSIGIRDLRSLKKLRILLKRKYPKEDFYNAVVKVILSETGLRTWLFITDEQYWFVSDNGLKTKVFNLPRNDLQYSMEEYIQSPEYGKMVIKNISYPIIFNKSFTGDTKSFKSFLDSYKITE